MKITYDEIANFIRSHRDMQFSLSSDCTRDDIVFHATNFNDHVRAMYASCNLTFDDDAMYFNDTTSLDCASVIANDIIDSYDRDDDDYTNKYHCHGDDGVDYQGTNATLLIDIARVMIDA